MQHLTFNMQLFNMQLFDMQLFTIAILPIGLNDRGVTKYWGLTGCRRWRMEKVEAVLHRAVLAKSEIHF